MALQEKQRRRWLGGYVYEGKRGVSFVIERIIRGEKFHVSTGCRTESAALKELARFEEDPRGYVQHSNLDERLLLSPELVAKYRRYMLDVKRNSRPWVNDVVRMLGHWALDLGELDLRDVSVTRDLKPALEERSTSKKSRIEAIKGFYAWLRKEEGALRHHEDPTLDLPVPADIAAKTKRRRVVDEPWVFAVLPKLPEQSRDVLSLQLATAWHTSEVRRFAEGGEVVRPIGGDPLAVLVVRHKRGELHSTPIEHAEYLEVAERIRARGRIPSDWTLAQHLQRACEKVGVPQFRNGVMRHSVLTWAKDRGATMAQLAEFAGHKSEATTRKFYVDTATPTVRIPVVRLLKPG